MKTKNESNKTVIIELIDNGCGMSQKTIGKILGSKFFSTKGSRGTGIGLSVTQKVINEHKGTLEIKSTPGEGSTFCLHLPLVTDLHTSS